MGRLSRIRCWTDRPSRSARYKPRQRWRELLAAIRGGQVDAVLLTDTSRLQREMRDLLDLIDACDRRNIPIHTVRAGDYDLSTPAGRMVAKVVTAKDELEWEQLRERLREGHRHKAARGEWGGGRRPFGYQADGVTPDRREALALKWAAASLLTGSSLNAVCARLNEKKIRTSTDKEWHPTELRRVLARPRNAGLRQHRICGEVQKPGEHHHTDDCWKIAGRAEWPAILDEDVWRGVVALLADPARRTNKGTARRWMLAGIAVCGVCGEPVKSWSAKAKRRNTKPAYTCRAAGTSSGHVIRNAAEVDAYVEQIVLAILTDRRDQLLVPDQTGDTSTLHLRDAALRAQLDGAARSYAAGAIELGQLETITATIRAEREAVTAQLAAMTQGSVLAGVADAADPEAVWRGLDLSRKREIIRVLMTVIILPAKRGRRAGWRAGESYFDPATVRIEPKR
jgi:site-specific DNA recombinase